MLFLCYTFHDGFFKLYKFDEWGTSYKIKEYFWDSEIVVNRFYHACIGWVRYKPLLLYITQQDSYEEKIDEMRKQIEASLPKVCDYFGNKDFLNISKEFEKYNRNVKKHYEQYRMMKQIWGKILKNREEEKELFN
jgi:hypothetical protein